MVRPWLSTTSTNSWPGSGCIRIEKEGEVLHVVCATTILSDLSTWKEHYPCGLIPRRAAHIHKCEAQPEPLLCVRPDRIARYSPVERLYRHSCETRTSAAFPGSPAFH